MAIKIVPHAADKKDLVEAFNAKMRAGGSPWGFYVDPEPYWIPKTEDDQPVWREFHLAIEDGDECVGGYGLKPQRWLIRGEEVTVTDWQGPFSLGAVDNRYASLGLRFIRDMLRKQPMLYSWGHGGSDEKIVQLVKKLGWLLHETPFLFRVCQPKNFLQKNALLRKDPRKALAQDVLAISGLGTLGLHALHAALRMKSLTRFEARYEPVADFASWTDEVWERAKGDYLALAVRDQRAMRTLLPVEQRHSEWPAPTRIRVLKDGRTIGWAAVVEKQLSGDARFGEMRVGVVADAFGAIEDAPEVAHAAFDHLRASGVDMVMVNHSHPAWIAAYEAAGFFKVEDRRVFCASPKLLAALEPFEETKRGLFLTNMDGHGPMLG
ncbi:MAG: hypothetical protein AB7S26_42635 [Sandaracinaceae bacterium]